MTGGSFSPCVFPLQEKRDGRLPRSGLNVFGHQVVVFFFPGNDAHDFCFSSVLNEQDAILLPKC